MTSTSDELLPCPFCGGKAHIRSKIFYRINELHREAIVYDYDPLFGGESENTVNLLDWQFGYQVWCGRCKVKTPYKRGPWHAYTADEIEELEREDFYNHAPNDTDKPAMLAAIDAWNRRVSDDSTD